MLLLDAVVKTELLDCVIAVQNSVALGARSVLLVGRSCRFIVVLYL